MRFAKVLATAYGVPINSGPKTNAAPGRISRKIRNCEIRSRRIAMAIKSPTDEKAFASIFSRCWSWNASAQRKAGLPARASFAPSHSPSKIATIGCTINLSRPGPDNRATMSSKKCSVNRYRLPVCMSLRIAPGSAARIITITTVVRIELRDSETFISRMSIKDRG